MYVCVYTNKQFVFSIIFYVYHYHFQVDELLHCYLDTIACHLLTVAQSPSALPPSVPVGNIPPASLYVGVSVWYSPIAHATAQFAAFLSGTDISRSKDECKSLENESVCIKITLLFMKNK